MTEKKKAPIEIAIRLNRAAELGKASVVAGACDGVIVGTMTNGESAQWFSFDGQSLDAIAPSDLVSAWRLLGMAIAERIPPGGDIWRCIQECIEKLGHESG